MFLNNLLNTIKNKTSSRASSKGSDSKSQRDSSSPQLYEEVKLNKSNFGAKNQSELNDNDIMSEFVIVDFKEYAPYTLEEWEAILSHSDLITVDNQRLYVSLRKGIPKKFRKRIWLYLSQAEELKQENAKKGITYEWLLTQECPDKHNIIKDITRTFPELEFFNEHTEERLKHLENILSAYAVFDPEVGYTQGINFLVATLIYYMYAENQGKDYTLNNMEFESEIFWILVHILQTKNWRNLYVDETPKLIELINRLEHRISSELPKLYDLFQEHLLIPACFSQCFLTLLFYNSPMKFSKRVLDMFLLVGEDIILELVMKMLTLCEKDILEKTEIEELYPFLRSKLTQFTFEKYEKEFANLVDEQNVISIIEYD